MASSGVSAIVSRLSTNVAMQQHRLSTRRADRCHSGRRAAATSRRGNLPPTAADLEIIQHIDF
eukprot:7170670-Pyramimonas_sp.AAC.1